MSSCSQTLYTLHPSARSVESVSRSRFTFISSFCTHHSLLFFGVDPCRGHECQKHPSTNTATFLLLNKMSARRRGRLGRGASTRYLRPRAWRCCRRSNSGLVSRRRCRDMRDRTLSVAANLDVSLGSPVSLMTSLFAFAWRPAACRCSNQLHVLWDFWSAEVASHLSAGVGTTS